MPSTSRNRCGSASMTSRARRDHGRVADDGHEIPEAARLDPQHAEAALGIVESNPSNDAGEHFPVGLIGSRRCGHDWNVPTGRTDGNKTAGHGPRGQGKSPINRSPMPAPAQVVPTENLIRAGTGAAMR